MATETLLVLLEHSIASTIVAIFKFKPSTY